LKFVFQGCMIFQPQHMLLTAQEGSITVYELSPRGTMQVNYGLNYCACLEHEHNNTIAHILFLNTCPYNSSSIYTPTRTQTRRQLWRIKVRYLLWQDRFVLVYLALWHNLGLEGVTYKNGYRTIYKWLHYTTCTLHSPCIRVALPGESFHVKPDWFDLILHIHYTGSRFSMHKHKVQLAFNLSLWCR